MVLFQCPTCCDTSSALPCSPVRRTPTTWTYQRAAVVLGQLPHFNNIWFCCSVRLLRYIERFALQSCEKNTNYLNMPEAPLCFAVRRLSYCNNTWFVPVSHLLRYIERFSLQSREKNTNYLNMPEGAVVPGVTSGAGGRRRSSSGGTSRLRRKSSVKGIIRRTCSIQVEPEDMPGMSPLLATYHCTSLWCRG